MNKILMTLALVPVLAMAIEPSPSYSLEAVAKYKEKADAGDAEAQYMYARALANGEGVAHNSKLAFDYAKRAADQGFELSYRTVGMGHEFGWGGSSNVAEAAVWYGKFHAWAKTAAEKGDVWAQYQLGLCLEYGNGVAKDAGEAVKLYRKAAELGSALAQQRLGYCYRDGIGVKANFAEALSWFRKAAEQGDVGAQCALAGCCLSRQYSNWMRENGVKGKRGEDEALIWYRKAADQGNTWAQTRVGECYENGRGVKKNPAEGIKWYRKAAELGSDEAQCILGLCYMHGIGVETNYAESVKWYRKAAEQGSWSAFLGQSALGMCYENGWGVATNKAEAVKWYLKAAAQDWGSAQYHLVICYANGEGVERNLKEALKWYCMFAKYPYRRSGDPEKEDESYRGGIRRPEGADAEQVARAQRAYDALLALSEEIKGAASEVKSAYDKDLSGAKFRLDRAKKRCLRSKELATAKIAAGMSVVAQKLRGCDFLVNEQFKQNAKVYLCLYSASWCGPCRKEMPRIAKTYAEKLKADPDIELIHFSRDQDDEKAMSWAKEHDVKFSVVAPDGGNPLNLQPRGIPHLYIFKADGTLLEEGHPMKLFTEAKISELKVSAASESAQASQTPRPLLGVRRRPGQPASNVQQKGAAEVAAKFGDGGYVPGLQQGVFEKFAQQFSRDFSAILKCGKTCADANRYSHAFGTILADVDVISHEVQNEQMGTVEKFNENDAVLYEGEIYLEGGKEYAFFVAVDDWASIEIDGERILSGGYRECCRGDRWKKGSRLIASKTVEKSGWHPIRVWMCDICNGGSPMLGFGGMGIGWNAEGCKELNAATFSKWQPLRDDGSGRFLRSKPMPPKAAPRCGGLLGGSLRARRLQRQQAAQQVVQKKETIDGYTWSYRVNNGEATIVAENRGRFSCAVSPSPKGSLTIPSTLGDAKVTGIGPDAFNGCVGLESVTIPESVTDIGERAFWGCKITSLALPSALRGIGGNAFRACANLTTVSIPASVANIGGGSFSDCSGLKQINVVADNQKYVSVDGVLYTKDRTKLVMCPGGATSVTIQECVTSIGQTAFEGCCGLTAVTIPSGVREIETWAFKNCKGLRSVTIPEGVMNIAGESFRECGSLTSLSLPSSLMSIGNAAFRSCTNLTAVMIPSNVVSIGVAAFTDCTGLRRIDVSADNSKYASVDGVLYTKDRTEAVMCPGALTSAALPESVTSIGPCAFEGCGELTSVTMPGCVTNIGPYAFKRCVKLRALTIPEGVTSIGRDALMECHGLTSLTLPNSMTNIGWAAFAHCDSLKLLTIPSNVTIIAGAAFSHCCKLESVTIPPAVKSIGPWTFDCCEGLTSVTIPEYVTSIKGCAFRACTNLMSVTMRGGYPDSQRDVFKGCGKLKEIHVPSNSLSWAKMKDWQGIPLVFDGEVMSPAALVQDAERIAEAERQAAERAQREVERAEQRQQLLKIQEELKRVRAQKAAAECAASCAANESTAATSRVANSSTNDSLNAKGPVTLTGPYGLRIEADPGCEKGAEYVLKRLEDDILPCALRYYGDPFIGQKPTRVFTLHVKRNDGTGKSKYTGVSWGSCGDGIDSFTIGLAKGSDKWEMDLSLVASKILTVCSESDSAAFSIYANDFVRGEIDHYNPVPKIKEDIRKGLGQGEAENEREKRRLGVLRKLAPTWAAFEELREKYPTLVLDYCNLKNSKYAKGELPQKISADQMATLMGEVTGVDAAAIFKKHSAAFVPSTPEGKIVVAEKLGQCDFLLNKDFKKSAKFYLCLFSASWCPPCRREMPRIAKTYAETLKDDPDIELIHFSRDQNDEKALAWAKEHDVKFPVVKPKGGNPLDLHSRGIPHLFIVKADGTLVEEGHPMRIFNEEKFREIKTGRMEPRIANASAKENELTSEADGYTWTYTIKDGTAVIGAITDGRCRMSERRCAISPNPTGHITIPSTLDGVKVVSIGENALCGCKGIRSVTIPEGVTIIGRSAFNRCEGLTDVKIPNSVTTIGEYSFDWCGSMTNVTLGEGVTTIGSCAFRGCYGLTGIRIPKNVKNIEGSAFIFSRKMKEFVVDEENENFTTVNGMILSKDRRKLHVGVNGDVSIPDGVTSVLSMAFCRRSGLTSVKLPNSVTNIDGFSFATCCALKTVTIQASVMSIGTSAFSGCKELAFLTMCGEKPNVGENVFVGCDKLKKIHVPANAKSWAGMKEWQGIPLVFDGSENAFPKMHNGMPVASTF